MDKSSTTSTPLKNQKHEIFAQHVANGLNATDAYAETYNLKNKATARKNASRLQTNALVRARVRELQEENARQNALSRAEKRFLLARIARGEITTEVPDHKDGGVFTVPPSIKDRIAAIQEDNRMTGESAESVNLKNESITFNLGDLFNAD